MRRTTLALIFGAVLLYGTAPVAAGQGAAPTLIDSRPQDGETVHEAPEQVEMTFSEPLDDSSQIEVRDECNRRVDTGETTIQLNEMSVDIAKEPGGLYVASYRATGLGGITGTSNGSISFTVHMGPSCDGSGSGGHDGHGGKGGGGGGGKHGGHKGSDGEGDHSGSGHPSGTTAHAAGGHSGAVHAAGSGGPHGQHKKDKGKGKHAGHRKGNDETSGDDPPVTELAAPGDLVPTPDGTTLLVALGASIVLGAAGGLLMRIGVRL